MNQKRWWMNVASIIRIRPGSREDGVWCAGYWLASRSLCQVLSLFVNGGFTQIISKLFSDEWSQLDQSEVTAPDIDQWAASIELLGHDRRPHSLMYWYRLQNNSSLSSFGVYGVLSSDGLLEYVFVVLLQNFLSYDGCKVNIWREGGGIEQGRGQLGRNETDKMYWFLLLPVTTPCFSWPILHQPSHHDVDINTDSRLNIGIEIMTPLQPWCWDKEFIQRGFLETFLSINQNQEIWRIYVF